MPIVARYALYVVLILATVGTLLWIIWQGLMLLAAAVSQYLLLVVLAVFGPEALIAPGVPL